MRIMPPRSAWLTRVNSRVAGHFHNGGGSFGAFAPRLMNITGIVVYTRPESSGAVRESLGRIGGVEVHAANADGRLVVTVEQPDDESSTAVFESIARIDGVLNTALVYHHDESLTEASEPNRS